MYACVWLQKTDSVIQLVPWSETNKGKQQHKHWLFDDELTYC